MKDFKKPIYKPIDWVFINIILLTILTLINTCLILK